MINGIRNEKIDFQRVNTTKPAKNIFMTGKINELEADTFEKKVDASNDGKFTFKEALKNFGKGLISPIKAIIQHPIMALGTVALMGAACVAAPVLAPILGIGFAGLSVVQLTKALVNTTIDYKQGNYDNAEKGFENIGAGVLNTVLSVLGLKSTAKIAAEAKFMHKNNLTVLTDAQREEVALNTPKGLLNSIKENLSLITTKEGRSATIAQFKPQVMKERFNSFFKKTLKDIEVKETRKRKIQEFEKTEEGIRRANLTEEQIKAEIQTKFDAAFDELGVPKEQRPKLEVKNADKNHGGSYNGGQHKLEINPEGYKSGVFELDDVIMHEATHCKEALIRSALPKDVTEQIVIEELTKRIINGENEQILQNGGFLSPTMMNPPKMSAGMRSDFAQFAKSYIYGNKNNEEVLKLLSTYNSNKSMLTNQFTSAGDKIKYVEEIAEIEPKIQPLLNELKTLMSKHPEFQQTYNTPENALDVLCKYTQSHNFRYRYFINNKIKVNGAVLNTEPLTPEMLEYAKQSLRDNITTIEGNAGVSGLNGIFATQSKFNQYQFSPEEVLAQKNGNNYLIKNLTREIEEMRQAGTLTPEREAYLNSVITKAQNVIKYKTTGLEYYQKYTQLLNNPDNVQLAQEVKMLEARVLELQKSLKPSEVEEITKIVQVLQSDHASATLPLNITALLEAMRNKSN